LFSIVVMKDQVRLRMKDKGYSMIDVSNKLGIHWNSFYRKLNNPEQFTILELEKLHKLDLIITI
jgi:hypothetical protein